MDSRSVDPAEHAKFERLAAAWWDAEGSFWPLHRLNALRVAFIQDEWCRSTGREPHTSYPLQGLTCLDIGCGGGILSEAIARLGAQVHGVDVVERNVRIARAHAEQSGLAIRYEHASAEDLAARGLSFDCVLNMEVVEHVADVASFLRASSALVAPQGLMFVASLNRTFAAWLTAIVGAEYVLGWLPRGTHDWRKFPRIGELDAQLLANGLETTQRIGVRINPITRAFALTAYLGVNFMLVARRRGERS